MKFHKCKIQGLVEIEPNVFADDRGVFFQSWQKTEYEQMGLPGMFVQDNVSVSKKNVLRGLHLQHPHGQGKLVSVLKGIVFDVAVDVRVGSETFGHWHAVELSEANHKQFYIPPGFAHGFCVLSDEAVFQYKCSEFYHRESELSLLWNDPDIGIKWPVSYPSLSPKDAQGLCLNQIARDKLPHI